MKEHGGFANRESHYFEIFSSNYPDLYEAILGYSQNLLRRVPSMTPQTFGYNIKSEVRMWIEQAMTGKPIYSLGWWDRPIQVNPKTLIEMANTIGIDNYHKISEMDIANSWLETVRGE